MNKRDLKKVRKFDLTLDREALLEQSGKLLELEELQDASPFETDVMAGLMLFGPESFSLRWPWLLWDNDHSVFRRTGIFPNLDAIGRVSVEDYGYTIVDNERTLINDPVTVALQLYGTDAKPEPTIWSFHNESQSIVTARLFYKNVPRNQHRDILRRSGFTHVTCPATAALLGTTLNSRL